MNKRGQFYLIAAVIIIVIIIGFVSVTNYSVVRNDQGSVKLYELSKDLELEGESVINFGIFNEVDIDTTLREFTEDYGEYLGERENDVYFVYGDKTQVKVVGYIRRAQGSIGLNFATTVITTDIFGSVVDIATVDFKDKGLIDADTGEIENPNVIIEISGSKYPFKLKEGKNFFFVIRQPIGSGDENLEIGVSNSNDE